MVKEVSITDLGKILELSSKKLRTTGIKYQFHSQYQSSVCALYQSNKQGHVLNHVN